MSVFTRLLREASRQIREMEREMEKVSYYTDPDGHRNREAELDRIIDRLREDRSDARLRQLVMRAYNLGIETAAQHVDNARFYDGIPATAALIRKQAYPESK